MKKRTSTFTALVSVIALFAILTAATQFSQREKTAAALGALYERAYYELYTGLEDIYVKLEKLSVLPRSAAADELAADLWKQSYAVSVHLATLPTSQEPAQTLMRYVNQVGAYCMALTKQDHYTAQNRQDLFVLEQVCGELCENLSAMHSGIKTDAAYWTRALDALGSLPMDGLAPDGVSYPTLRYDGPFADAQIPQRKIEGESISVEQAEQIAAAFFSAGQQIQVQRGSDAQGENPFWGVDLVLQSGQILHAAVLKNGGQVLWMLGEQQPEKEILDVQTAQEAALAFLSQRGFENMLVTGVDQNGAVLTVCAARVQQEVLCYPEMIKVQISLEDGSVVGYDAAAYLHSAALRSFDAPELDAQSAIALVPDLETEAARLCVIPLYGREYTCWELIGQAQGHTYYVYLDAQSGEIITMLRQVEKPGSTLAI